MIKTRKTLKNAFLHEYGQRSIVQATELRATELQPNEEQPKEVKPTEVQPTEVQPTEVQVRRVQKNEAQNNFACLVLEDGTCFSGSSCGAPGELVGDIRFNTAMIGYLEIISDPAYAGTILVMTYPQVGNYGVALADIESDKAALRGLVVRDMCRTPSSFRSNASLSEYLRGQGIVALAGIDTRALFQHVQGCGSMRAILSTEEKDPAALLEKLRVYDGSGDEKLADERLADEKRAEEKLVEEVSCKKAWTLDPKHILVSQVSWQASYPVPSYKVVAIDCGITRSAMRHLTKAACSVTILPWNSSADEVKAYKPDGLYISGGPGNPRALVSTREMLAELLGQLPVLGVGLGHQLIALSAGGQTKRMKNAHDGNNHPVMDLRTRSVTVTSQHHQYSVVIDSLGSMVSEEYINETGVPVAQNARFGRIQLSHIHVDDKSVEGLRFLDIPVLSVQFHPSFSPEATAPHSLYVEFVRLMEDQRKAVSSAGASVAASAPASAATSAATSTSVCACASAATSASVRAGASAAADIEKDYCSGTEAENA